MKFIKILLVFCLINQGNLKGQLGLSLDFNIASQTIFDPTLPEDGTFLWNDLLTFGANIYYCHNLTQKFSSQLEFGYQEKGFKETALTGILGSSSSNGSYTNKFHHLTLRGSAFYYLLTKNKSPFFSFGLETSYLLWTKLQSAEHPIIGLVYPHNLYNDFNKWLFTYIIGIGMRVERTIIHLKFNRDINPIIKKENLVVKNWIWTAQIYIPILTKKSE